MNGEKFVALPLLCGFLLASIMMILIADGER